MIYFLDASALVKRYVKEAGSEDVRRLVRRKARLLRDLKDIGARKGRAAEVRRRIDDLQKEHSAKVTFVERLRKAGLLPTRTPHDSDASGKRANSFPQHPSAIRSRS